MKNKNYYLAKVLGNNFVSEGLNFGSISILGILKKFDSATHILADIHLVIGDIEASYISKKESLFYPLWI